VGQGKVTVATGLTGVDLQQQIAAGFGDGSWNGTGGITSSAAAATPFRAVGWLDNGDGSVTFGFAATGDTNLDGQVSLADLMNVLAAGKYGSAAAASWADGDFNYDGFVNLQDLIDILASGVYGQGDYTATPRVRFDRSGFGGSLLRGGAPASLQTISATASGFDAERAITAVPEPAAWVLWATASAWLASRYRRRR